MTWTIVFSKAARREFDQAYDDYESKKEGLGDDFARCVQVELDHLAMNPKIHAKVYKEARRAVVKRFPYSVLYVIKASRVHIASVFHDKQDPNNWQMRIK